MVEGQDSFPTTQMFVSADHGSVTRECNLIIEETFARQQARVDHAKASSDPGAVNEEFGMILIFRTAKVPRVSKAKQTIFVSIDMDSLPLSVPHERPLLV